MTTPDTDALSEQRWQAEMRVKWLDVWMKVVGTLAVVAGILVALHNNTAILKAQQELLKAHEDRERGKALFEAKLELYRQIAAVAFRLRDSRDQSEATRLASRLRDLQADGSLVLPYPLVHTLTEIRNAVVRYEETGQRDDRRVEGKPDPKDLSASCARLIAACRMRVLHASGLNSIEEEAENAVSTAAGAVAGNAGEIR